MDKQTRIKLKEQGWEIGTVSDFLELTPEEEFLVEIKLALSRNLKERRQSLMTQSDLAEKIHSSQPRVVNAEKVILLYLSSY